MQDVGSAFMRRGSEHQGATAARSLGVDVWQSTVFPLRLPHVLQHVAVNYFSKSRSSVAGGPFLHVFASTSFAKALMIETRQLNYILVNHAYLKYCTNSEAGEFIMNSEHGDVMAELRLPVSMWQKRQQEDKSTGTLETHRESRCVGRQRRIRETTQANRGHTHDERGRRRDGAEATTQHQKRRYKDT